jgi:hypothetical protein
MKGTNQPVRQGVQRQYTFDRFSLELMQEMVAGEKNYGVFLSTLIQQEYWRRDERRKARQALLAEVERAIG